MARTPTEEFLRKSTFLTVSSQGTLDGASPVTVTLTPGVWLVVCDVDCRFLQGDGTQTVAASTDGVPLFAKTYLQIFVSGDSDAAIVAFSSSTGTFEALAVS